VRKAVPLLSGIALLLCLGTVYSYSVFRGPLEKTLEIGAVQSGLPYMLALFFYALLMPFAGRFIGKWPPQWIALTGGSVMGLGWILAGTFRSFPSLVVFYGILGGIGVGIAYGVPLAVSARWYRENPGLAVGTTVVGFGLSPLVTAPLVRKLVELSGPFFALRVMGILFLILTAGLSLLQRFPKDASIPQTTTSSSPRKTARHKEFWLLWFAFFCGTFVGLTTIGITASVAQEMVQLSYATAAFSVSLFALFNGLGRPLFGHLVDRWGFVRAALTSYGLILLGALLFLSAPQNPVAYFVSFPLLWMNLGAWLSIAPSATLKFFGVESYAQNYGLLFTAYGVAALLGTFVSSFLREMTGSYSGIFFFNIGLVIVATGGVLAAFKPKKVAREENP
jgi:OFA family oxalate/formate antiporter-like MFS transporter